MLGYKVPSPIIYYYDFPGVHPAFDSQKKTAGLLSMNKRAYCLNGMGTGKTLSALYAADWLMRTDEAWRCLVIAPLSTLTPTWAREIMLNIPDRNAVILHGYNKAKRLRNLEQPADFYLINHDGVETIQHELLARKFDLIIVDELAEYRNKSTDRWKNLKTLVRRANFAWGLTGAPTPNAPTDAYGQAMLLRPDTAGTFTGFRDATMYKITQFKWKARPNAVDTVYDLLRPSVRFKLEDCQDIPETSYITRTVPMSPVQTKFYKLLHAKLALQYKEHQIRAVNEGVKLGKLLQISAGYVYTDEKKTIGLNPAARYMELERLISECEYKVIVFVPFIHAIKEVTKFVNKLGYTTGLIYSKVPKKQRDTILGAFQHSPDPRVLIAHPKTLSHGLNLTAATLIVWWSPTNNLDTYIQANARIPRAGQQHKTVIAHLEGSPAERATYRRLKEKETLQGTLLELFEGVRDVA